MNGRRPCSCSPNSGTGADPGRPHDRDEPDPLLSLRAMAATSPRSKPTATKGTTTKSAPTPAVVVETPAPAKATPRRGQRRGQALSRTKAGGDVDIEGLRAELKASIAEHHPTADLTAVDAAFDLAVEAHTGQRRATGEPYVTHPIASAQILAELGIDPIAIQAALLHDVPEDTEYNLTDIEERFGAEVAQLVDGVTKLSRFSTHSHEQQQAENIRKMLLAMAQDIRVVLIKLADRLHNMRTLYGLPSDKQQRIARQTMEIYAPLAERLGIWQMKWELEDLAFKVLEPERFRELAKLLDTRRKGRETYIERAIAELKPRLEAAGIDADVEGRPKHIYSIWKKMQRKSAEFGEIYDVYAIRLLVDDVKECYAALGIVHSITPWNFPMAIPSWKIVPALVCGNTVVFKPASQTPLSAMNFVKVLRRPAFRLASSTWSPATATRSARR